MRCDYCGALASARIPSPRSDVCLTHAIAFWKGFLAYARTERLAQRKVERLSALAAHRKRTRGVPAASPGMTAAVSRRRPARG